MRIILGTVEVHRGSACTTKLWYGLDWHGLVWFVVFFYPVNIGLLSILVFTLLSSILVFT